MCVARFSWKRALIAISSNAHHTADEVISPAPAPSSSLSLSLPPRIRQAFAVGLGSASDAVLSRFWVGFGLVLGLERE